MSRFLYILLLSLVAAVLYWTTVGPLHIPLYELIPKRSGTVLFVGDVMLSRNVELLMREHGFDYPFSETKEFITAHDFSVGNLEGTAPEKHEPTPSGSFRFSIDTTYLPALRRAGFSILTLANNHAYDFGERAYTHTKRALEALDLLSVGHPLRESVDDSLIITVGETKLALIPVHAVGRVPDEGELRDAIRTLSEKSDVQFVIPHWGEEYVPKAPEAVRALAHAYIDAGADAVIGHHPHVVQDIEIYKEAPIFYSLGNFVFDQYFSEEVQQGLALSVTIHPDRMMFDIVPLLSVASVPSVLSEPARTEALFALAQKSDPTIAADIRAGTLTILR